MKKYYAIGSLILIFLFYSCSSKVVTRNYYILEFPDQGHLTVSDTPLVNASCEIFAVTIPPAFSQARIAVRKRSHEISYYQNHLWAVTPGDLIAQLIEDFIQSENIFSKASRSIWKEVPVYRINCNVLQIEALDIDDELYAHLKMQINLFNRSENINLVNHKFDRKEILKERDINLLAESLSKILLEELIVFSNDIKKEIIK